MPFDMMRGASSGMSCSALIIPSQQKAAEQRAATDELHADKLVDRVAQLAVDNSLDVLDVALAPTGGHERGAISVGELKRL
jgi:hypothetical protein